MVISLGRVKGTLMKRNAETLVKKNPGSFSLDFTENKKILKGVESLANVARKEMNKLAGEVTTVVHQLARHNK